jgi:trk system potassium uptake protein TrkA
VIYQLKKLGVPEIIVKSDSESRNEILKLVGATRIVNADREAAARIAPLVLATSLYNFMPIGGDLVIAEVHNPKDLVGKTIIEADLRRKMGINVIAARREGMQSYQDFDRDYRLREDDHLLVAGKEKDVFAFSDLPLAPTQKQRGSTIGGVLKTMFKMGKAKSRKS